MIKVLKETPVTAYGHDCLEQLVHDDDCTYNFVCDNCCYRDWRDYQETAADCCTVHGYTLDPNAYFILKSL